MKIKINVTGRLFVEDLTDQEAYYEPIILKLDTGEKLAISTRNGGFAVDYITKQVSREIILKDGELDICDVVDNHKPGQLINKTNYDHYKKNIS